MNNNKFIKFLIILNGVMLPVLLGFGIFMIAKEFWPRQERHEVIGVTVDDSLEEKGDESKPVQGLEYDTPEEIYNSTNYLLKVNLENYAKKGSKVFMPDYSYEDEYVKTYSNLVNVIFLDKNYQVIRTLLDRKASISKLGTREVQYRIYEERLKNYNTITYLISFEDTNGDGKLNKKDDHDLYVSNLSGGDLTQVTKGWDVTSWEVHHDRQTILIRYSERTEKENKDGKFAVYSMKNKELKLLDGLNGELEKIESNILK